MSFKIDFYKNNKTRKVISALDLTAFDHPKSTLHTPAERITNNTFDYFTNASNMNALIKAPLADVETRYAPRGAKSGGYFARPNRLPQDRIAFRMSKRAFDICVAGIAVVMLFPIFAVIALIIKATSPGAVMFRQERYGLNGELFSIFKFRSMCSIQGDTTGVQQTTKNDARITKIGAFIRRTSIDELPQLFNVLNGTMSIVGPRPHVPNMLANGVQYENFDARYMDRHALRPGITGLAQVNGFRGETNTFAAAHGRLNFDLEYIKTATVWGDIKIIVKTAVKEFLNGSGH